MPNHNSQTHTDTLLLITLNGSTDRLTLRVATTAERCIRGHGTATLSAFGKPSGNAQPAGRASASWSIHRWPGAEAPRFPGGSDAAAFLREVSAIAGDDALVLWPTRLGETESLPRPPLSVFVLVNEERFDAIWDTLRSPGLLTQRLGYRIELEGELPLTESEGRPRGDLTAFEYWLARGEELFATGLVALELSSDAAR